VRAIGVQALAANVVNCTIGSGIFALPAAVAAILGPSALVAYLICAAAIGLIALCFAEVGSRVTASGGAYSYIEAAFGPYLGFVAGVLFWLGTQATANAAVAVIFVDSLGALAPAVRATPARAAILVAVYVGLATINIRGVRAGARVVEALTAVKIVPLLLLVTAGLFALQPDHLAGFRLPSPDDLGRACLLLFFAFVGLEGALSASGEVREPSRTVPRAVLLGITLVVLLYAGLQVVSQGVLGPALAGEQDTPLAAVAGRITGEPGRTLILVAAALSTLGYLSGDVLASPRVPFAFAENGLLPARVAAVHPRFRTPHVAIVAHAGLCMALALSGSFRGLALVSVVANLLVYLGCCAAVLELRRRDVRADGRPFRVPGGPLVPLLGCGVVLWLLASATRAEYLAAAVMVAAASVLYVVRRAASPAVRPAGASPGERW
jgi:amino acid transporter